MHEKSCLIPKFDASLEMLVILRTFETLATGLSLSPYLYHVDVEGDIATNQSRIGFLNLHSEPSLIELTQARTSLQPKQSQASTAIIYSSHHNMGEQQGGVILHSPPI